jgi:hypothetical protein
MNRHNLPVSFSHAVTRKTGWQAFALSMLLLLSGRSALADEGLANFRHIAGPGEEPAALFHGLLRSVSYDITYFTPTVFRLVAISMSDL